MLQRLELINYRGFSHHAFSLRELSVIVGRNNAGKSTVVESLRILAIITARLDRLSFNAPPDWVNLPLNHVGISPAVLGLSLQFETISNQYGQEHAEILATFVTGETIHVWLDTDAQIFAVLRDGTGEIIRSRSAALAAKFPTIEVLPQITPLEQVEKVLVENYVKRSISTPLASRHFRNQLKFDPKSYRKFRKIAEETWNGIQIVELEGARAQYGKPLRLMVRDRDFVAEIGLMGHGLQMWLQTMWFLCRCNSTATVVLDEPDVYMHPDLQRQLIRIVRGRFPQVIVATHSIEIVADLDPSEILIVDRTQNESKFADTLPAVQTLIDGIGGIHNIHLARLWHARRCILVEGDDLSYIKILHDKLHSHAQVAMDDIPNSPIGGWNGWPYAIGHNMMAKNSLGEDVRVYCLLDSDYHTPEEIYARMEEAHKRQVELYIWNRKELENYFINANVISRVVCSRNLELDLGTVRADIQNFINCASIEMKDDVFDAYATQFRDLDPKKGVKAANRAARELLDNKFDTVDGAMQRISGKELLNRISFYLHEKYGRGISLRNIVKEMMKNEIPREVQMVIDAIENNHKFKPRSDFQDI